MSAFAVKNNFSNFINKRPWAFVRLEPYVLKRSGGSILLYKVGNIIGESREIKISDPGNLFFNDFL